MMAHRELEERHLQLYKVRAHSVRGIATSLNFWKNRSISQVLQAATWKTPSVFAKHYLKDMEKYSPEDLVYSLGPIVAGGGVVDTQ